MRTGRRDADAPAVVAHQQESDLHHQRRVVGDALPLVAGRPLARAHPPVGVGGSAQRPSTSSTRSGPDLLPRWSAVTTSTSASCRSSRPRDCRLAIKAGGLRRRYNVTTCRCALRDPTIRTRRWSEEDHHESRRRRAPPVRSCGPQPVAPSRRARPARRPGGQPQPSRPWHLSALRLQPFARTLHRELGRRAWRCGPCGTYHGWNGSAASPVADARAALDGVRRTHGPVRWCSSGARWGPGPRCGWPPTRSSAASPHWRLAPRRRARRRPRRRGPAGARPHRQVDRPGGRRRWARRARPVAADLSLTLLAGTGRFMLRRPLVWSTLARERDRGSGPRAGRSPTRGRPAPSGAPVAPNPL